MHVFVVPSGGEVSGGNLYNAALIGGLRLANVACVEADVASASQLLEAGASGIFWVDTLFLDAFPSLVGAQRGPRSVVGLLLHYLPSLVRHADGWSPTVISAEEDMALRSAAAFLVTGAFMGSVVEQLGLGGRPTLRVEPACAGLAAPRAPYRPSPAPVTALLVANLVEGKGVLPFLQRLSGLLRAEDGLRVEIVGRFDMDPPYADACRTAILSDDVLRGAVHLLGPLPPDACRERMLASEIFVSASRMESYGMALAEARACGMVVVARAGGNVAQHVDPASGGRLCADDDEVASACVALARDRGALSRRSALAVGGAPRGRAWSAAADEYLRKVSDLRLV